MTAANYLKNAQGSLDALEDVLRRAAAQRATADEVLDQALTHLRQARQIIASMSDEEGTE
jgi:predicted NBD/HSP70 family sugar kinase